MGSGCWLDCQNLSSCICIFVSGQLPNWVGVVAVGYLS